MLPETCIPDLGEVLGIKFAIIYIEREKIPERFK